MEEQRKYIEQTVVGKSVEEAKKIATDNGFSLRVTRVNGVSKIVTAELNSGRLNASAKNGVIDKALDWG